MPRYKRIGKTLGVNISRSGISSSIKLGRRSILLGRTTNKASEPPSVLYGVLVLVGLVAVVSTLCTLIGVGNFWIFIIDAVILLFVFLQFKQVNNLNIDLQDNDEKITAFKIESYIKEIQDWIPTSVEEINAQAKAVKTTDEAELFIQRIKQFIDELDSKKNEINTFKENQVTKYNGSALEKFLHACEDLITALDRQLKEMDRVLGEAERQLLEQTPDKK